MLQISFFLTAFTGLLLMPLSAHAKNQSPWTFNFFSDDHLYPHYIANPIRSSFSFQAQYFSYSEIPQSTDRRFDLNMGGIFSLIRLQPDNDPLRGFELSLEAGFRGQFDTGHSEDNIGWDGHYALYLDYRHNQKIAYRLGLHHTSSHVGDEYAERTGRQRINYTRQEVRLGSTWSVTNHWQTYVEIARSYDLRNKTLQQSGRAELGLQYDHPGFFTNRIGGYAAIDISAYEENNWSANTTLQAGINWPTAKRQWRLGIEYYDGRSQLGEFFQFHEKYLSLGLWLDL